VDHPDYRRIEAAIRFIEAHALEQPSLHDVAEHVGLSAFHFQRLFKSWAGVSPKCFLRALTVDSARRLLRKSAPVLDAAYAVGLSGAGRLHDLFVTIDAVSPGEFKSAGVNLAIDYAFHATPFGDCLVAETSRGICHLGFVTGDDRGGALRELQENWRYATLAENPQAGRLAIGQAFPTATAGSWPPVRLFVRGTNFQVKVWEAMLKIPEGAVVSYAALAEAVGRLGAQRAVGTAVGRNPVAYLIPCHRVLRSTGAFGGYRWGTVRKQAMLGYEAVRRR
jgi:AraC family transcriptional regulator of adaptative response/methylated-DNA-[protein]-cysteine methyltransferase